jgi:hypothetical protein
LSSLWFAYHKIHSFNCTIRKLKIFSKCTELCSMASIQL